MKYLMNCLLNLGKTLIIAITVIIIVALMAFVGIIIGSWVI